MTRSEFYANWLTYFACGISQADIEKYVVSTGNLLWHIFSWKLIDDTKFLSGDEARAAYDRVDKDSAIYIHWFEDETTHLLSRHMQNSRILDKMTEVYVVAYDFSWTYMKTHEEMCGPYFMKL